MNNKNIIAALAIQMVCINIFSQNNIPDTICSKNEKLSNIINQNTICTDKNGKPVSQSNSGTIIPSDFLDADNVAYISQSSGHKYRTLHGIYKDEIPYNGFFINQMLFDSGWLAYDFYKGGKFNYQWSLDFNKAIRNSTNDVMATDRTINTVNIFDNDVLVSGSRPIASKAHKDSIYFISETVDNKQIKSFNISAFTALYGELIDITPTDSGYIFNSFEKGRIEINYMPGNRRSIVFDENGIPADTLDVRFEELSEAPNPDRYPYLFAKNNYYLLKDSTRICLSENAESSEIAHTQTTLSKLLLPLTTTFYSRPHTLTSADICFFFDNGYWNTSGIFPSDYLIDNLFVINRNKADNTYNIDFYSKEGTLLTQMTQRNLPATKVAETLKSVRAEKVKQPKNKENSPVGK